jgi:ribokinase
MTDRAYDVVVLGGIGIDYLVKGEALPEQDASAPGEAFVSSAGGKGLNQAVGAARLGARVALVGRVGRDARGDAALDHLSRERVDTAYVVRDPARPTATTLVMVGRSGRRQSMMAAGATAAVGPEDVEAAAAAFARASIVLAPLEVPVAAIGTAARLATAAKARLLLDAGPPAELPDDLVRLAYLVRGNGTEIEALTGVKPSDAASAGRAAAILVRRGARCAAVGTAKGDLVVGDGLHLWMPHPPGDIVDLTGAGDAFCAALAADLARGASLETSARLAHAASIFATRQLGANASLATRDRLAAADDAAAG